jgi:predicted transcriptional regulator
LSLKPAFAAGILSGEKKFEFRRVIFAQPVDIIVVYVTVPVKRVVAEFDVRGIVRKPVSMLWDHTRHHAGIDEVYFRAYFHGCEYGYAIEVGDVRVYAEPMCPMEEFGVRPPQSFAYLHSA